MFAGNFILILFSFFIIPSEFCYCISDDDEEIKIPVQIRMIRAYGGDNEKEPPIIVLDNPQNDFQTPIGGSDVSIEFDIKAEVPPNLYARFIHCSANWNENDNVFLNDNIYSRTSSIEWTPAPVSSGYYSYRGKIKVPNIQVKFKFSGNWKMKLYEYYNDSIPLAETRFFVVLPKAKCDLAVYSDFYDPEFNFISPTGVTLEANVYAEQQLFDNQIHTVSFFRNNRWYEPYYSSMNKDINDLNSKYRFYVRNSVNGFAIAGKIYRIERIPAENEYRVLNLTDLGIYPSIKGVVRTALSDLRRRGEFLDYDDDGALITTFVSDYNDEYVNMEFRLEPDNWISKDDVYIAGSFNNWNPDASWQMYFDKDDRYYKIRHLIRRGRHNYMYATGKLNTTTGLINKISYDEFEGNNSNTSHTYLAFVYYREFEYGGYDSLIAIGSASMYGLFRR